MTVLEGVAIALAFLWGATPTAYLVARLRKGIDIRRYGSGNVGAANVIYHVGLRTGIGLGVFDGLVKGALPLFLAQRVGLGPWTQMGVALAAVTGHNWSPYLKFTGGRGITPTLGADIAFALWPELLMGIIVVGAIGWAWLRNLALWLPIGFCLMIPLAYLLDRPPHVVATLGGLVVLMGVKRLTANWEAPLPGEPRWRVFFHRFLYDRDVADHAEWVHRRPQGKPNA